MNATWQRQAFTIIEVLIVLVILGIMSSLAFPKLAGPSFEKAAFSEAVQHLSAYVTAEKSYALDHDGLYAADCGLLEIEVSFKGFGSLTCSQDGKAGNVAVRREGGGWSGNYTVSVDATLDTPEYSCTKGSGSADCPSYLLNLLPQSVFGGSGQGTSSKPGGSGKK